MKCSRFSVTSWKYWTFYLQSLRQKSQIFATSSYTGRLWQAERASERIPKPFSACQKSPAWTFLTASTAEHFDAIKMLLRPKSLDFQGFSAAGYWNARTQLCRCLWQKKAWLCFRSRTIWLNDSENQMVSRQGEQGVFSRCGSVTLRL